MAIFSINLPKLDQLHRCRAYFWQFYHDKNVTYSYAKCAPAVSLIILVIKKNVKKPRQSEISGRMPYVELFIVPKCFWEQFFFSKIFKNYRIEKRRVWGAFCIIICNIFIAIKLSKICSKSVILVKFWQFYAENNHNWSAVRHILISVFGFIIFSTCSYTQKEHLSRGAYLDFQLFCIVKLSRPWSQYPSPLIAQPRAAQMDGAELETIQLFNYSVHLEKEALGNYSTISAIPSVTNV